MLINLVHTNLLNAIQEFKFNNIVTEKITNIDLVNSKSKIDSIKSLNDFGLRQNSLTIYETVV